MESLRGNQAKRRVSIPILMAKWHGKIAAASFYWPENFHASKKISLVRRAFLLGPQLTVKVTAAARIFRGRRRHFLWPHSRRVFRIFRTEKMRPKWARIIFLLLRVSPTMDSRKQRMGDKETIGIPLFIIILGGGFNTPSVNSLPFEKRNKCRVKRREKREEGEP